MVTIRIYIEGGGDDSAQHTEFRQAWTKFFEKAGLKGAMPRIIAGKGRAHTFDMFKTELSRPTPNSVPLLLVDSEGAVKSGDSVWQHLKMRDQWDKPDETDDDQAFLMVQVMETWFLADVEALKKHFGKDFRESSFGKWPQLESVPKADVFKVLEEATRNCKKQYKKGVDSFKILGNVNPSLVKERCPHAKALLDRLLAFKSI